MRFIRLQPTLTLLCMYCATVAYAQQPQPAAAVPKLVRFSGSFRPANGPANGLTAQSMESVTLSVYGTKPAEMLCGTKFRTLSLMRTDTTQFSWEPR